jgi:hypothetical protein
MWNGKGGYSEMCGHTLNVTEDMGDELKRKENVRDTGMLPDVDDVGFNK